MKKFILVILAASIYGCATDEVQHFSTYHQVHVWKDSQGVIQLSEDSYRQEELWFIEQPTTQQPLGWSGASNIGSGSAIGK